MQFLILLGFMTIVVLMFIGTYYFNNNTEKPVEVDMAGCGGCHNINCGHHEANKKFKEEN